jgi:hypothetical protein
LDRILERSTLLVAPVMVSDRRLALLNRRLGGNNTFCAVARAAAMLCLSTWTRA